MAGLAVALLLRRAWNSRDRAGRTVATWAGWMAAVASVITAALSAGVVRGVAIAAAGLSVGILAVVLLPLLRDRRGTGSASREAAPATPTAPGGRRFLRGVLRAIVAGPLGLASATAGAASIVALAPLAPGLRLVIAGLGGVFIWAAAMGWAFADPRIVRPSACLAGVSLASALVTSLVRVA